MAGASIAGQGTTAAGLDEAVEQYHSELSTGSTSIFTESDETATITFQSAPPENATLETLVSLAEESPDSLKEAIGALAGQYPTLFREAMESFGISNPALFRQAVPDMYDSQTGLMSKDYFENCVLAQQIGRAREEETTISYLMIDIDGFKGFNDEYGHSIGDRVIELVSGVIKRSVRGFDRPAKDRHPDIVGIMRDELRYEEPTYQLARVGEGEEFAIILYDTSVGGAYVVGERLRKAIEEHTLQTKKYGPLGVTVSIGVAELEPGMDAKSLKEAADRELYSAKADGRNRVYARNYAHGYLQPPQKKEVA